MTFGPPQFGDSILPHFLELSKGSFPHLDVVGSEFFDKGVRLTGGIILDD